MEEIIVTYTDFHKELLPHFIKTEPKRQRMWTREELQEACGKLGLYYLMYHDENRHNPIDETYYTFQVIDEKLFFLTKIKFGI
jgi:hypothetical protein